MPLAFWFMSQRSPQPFATLAPLALQKPHPNPYPSRFLLEIPLLPRKLPEASWDFLPRGFTSFIFTACIVCDLV